jgi:glycosyltransferase involved in cell wall biosynthesis
MHVGLVTRGDVAYTLDLAGQLHKAGIAITLYLPYAHTVREVGTSEQPKERLYEIGLVPRECRVRLIRLPRMRDLRSLAVFRRLSQTIRDEGVDVAHLLVGPDEFWFALLASLLHDIPVTTTMIEPTRDAGQSFPFPLIWAIQKLLAYGSDMIIVNGTEQVESVQKLYNLPGDRVVYVPLNVRSTAIQWATGTVPEEPGTVLFFGRAVPSKGLMYLVQAQPIVTRRVPHARILISAHGGELERCRRMIQDESRFEIHEGFVPGDVMTAYFQRASLVAIPYLSSTSSGVLMMAYAFAKPVVATNIGGLSDYVQDGVTGFLVPPGQPEPLAHAIVRLLSDDASRRRMGENAKRWVQEWQENITQKTLTAYEQAISTHSNRGQRQAKKT